MVGTGSVRYEAQGKVVYAMKVTKTLTFDEYFDNADFRAKKPGKGTRWDT